MKNFDDLLIVVGRVVNQNRAVKELADLGTFSHQSPHSRKASEKIDVVEQRTAKTRSCLGVILGDISDDFCEIV